MVGKRSAKRRGGAVADKGRSKSDEEVAERGFPIVTSGRKEPIMTRAAHTVALAAAALSLVAAAQPCGAQNLQLYNGYSNDPSKVVTYTRIHLSRSEMQTAAGARTALKQIEAAADAVCGGAVHARVSPLDYEACRRDAEDAAVRTLDRPMVEAALTERRREAQQAAR